MNALSIDFARSTSSLVHAGSVGADVPLTVFDQDYGLQITTRAYAYRATLEPEPLRRALRRLLQQLPLLAGRLVSGDDGGLRVVCADQGAELCVRELPGALPDFDTQRDGGGQIARWAGRGFASPGDRDVPLLRVRVTRFRAGGSIVGIALPHALADAGTISRLMHAWSCLARGVPAPPLDSRRAALMAFEREAAEGLSRSRAQRLRARVRDAAFIARIVRRIVPLQVRVFEIDQRELAPVLAAGPAALSQDLIQAHLWRVLSAVSGSDTSTRAHAPELALTSVLNLRQRLAPLLDEHYFGNAVTNITCRLPRAQVHEQPLRQLAESIRASRRQHDAATARAEHAARCREWKSGTGLPLRDRVTDQALGGGICINSEVGTPLYDVDFGQGRPFWVVRPRFPIPRFALWSPAPREGRFHLRIGLPEAEMEALCSTQGQRRLCPGAARDLLERTAC